VVLLAAVRRAGLPAAVRGKIGAAIAARAPPHRGTPATAAGSCRGPKPAAIVDGTKAGSVCCCYGSAAGHVGESVPVLSGVRATEGSTGRRVVLLRLEAVRRRVLRRQRSCEQRILGNRRLALKKAEPLCVGCQQKQTDSGY